MKKTASQAAPTSSQIITRTQLRNQKTRPDNVRDHRAGTIILQAENSARKPGFACITLLSGVFVFLPVDPKYTLLPG
jgi:hypothetical protein